LIVLWCGTCFLIAWLWTRPPPRAERGRPWPAPPPRVSLAFLGVVVAAVALRSVSILILVLWLAVPARRLWRRRGERRAEQVLQTDLLAFVDHLVQQLRSGAALPSAFVEGIARWRRVDAALGDVAGALAGGVSLEHALRHHAGGLRTPAIRMVTAATLVLVSNGGPAAPAFDRLGEALRASAAADAEVRAQSSQALASSVVLSLLPVAFVLVLILIDDDAAHFYLRSVPGLGCLIAMTGLLAAGWIWIDLAVWGRRR
jgi:Flp pilus assembly protein TadB